MRRYIRSSRTRSNVRHTSALQDQFVRELTEQAQAVLTQLTQQFTQELQDQSAQMLANLVSAQATSTAGDALAGGGDGGMGGIGQLLSTGAGYLISRPRTSSATHETSRSQNATASFKVSTAQSLAEAGITLSKGDKNL